MSVEAIMNQAEELSLDQRAELLRRLEANLLDAGWQPDDELSDDVMKMLDERVRSADANPGAGIPWDVVKG
jgi:hypothetical protein